MPDLNWEAFAGLPGSAEWNFEQLCRSAVRLNWGQFGDFVARSNQPGIEFHLKLHTQCALGESGRWYGWQCKWWDLPGGRAIGTTRRKKVEEAIARSEADVPGLTDWRLVTRRPLTKGDQKWFFKIKTKLRLELVTGDDIETWLVGDAGLLRNAYFGELVLTPDRLSAVHDVAVASIQERWLHAVHQRVEAERAVRRSLGEGESWQVLIDHAAELERFADAVDSHASGMAAPMVAEVKDLIKQGRKAANRLRTVHSAVTVGDLDAVKNLLGDTGRAPPMSRPAVLRRLRTNSSPAAPPLTNLISLVRSCEQLLADLRSEIGCPISVVVADAGCGKTQLAAELTSAIDRRPAGILLYGRDLRARGRFDDLASRVVIDGLPVPSFEALLAALNAAGQRCGARMPLVVDGLNESEDPRDWKAELSSAATLVTRYPYVLLVVTVRSEFVQDCIPTSVQDQVEIEDFGVDAAEAMSRYFEYFKIDATGAAIPRGLLGHPLTLRIYCEVANPTRDTTVGVENLPYTLSPIFAEYLDRVAVRIADTSSSADRFWPQDVKNAYNALGSALWKKRSRTLSFRSAQQIVGDKNIPWENSMVRALEQNGVLLRFPASDGGGTDVAFVYDLLAGHAIAAALVNARGSIGIESMLKKTKPSLKLGGSIEERHPLAPDILEALASLLADARGRQLWEMVDSSLYLRALRAAADLEADAIDRRTVEELASRIQDLHVGRDVFARLQETRGSTEHPLNATFLDSVLRTMSVADRDLRWSEWLRNSHDRHLRDIGQLADRWRGGQGSTANGALEARWVMWTLTSTVRNLRDEATRALYWYGRFDAAGLFSLALESLTIDDPYVSERVVAAAYGVSMAHQVVDPNFLEPLRDYLVGLAEALIAADASSPTSHALTRQYVEDQFEFASIHYPDSLPAGFTFPVRFAQGPTVPPLAVDDPAVAEVDLTMHMDFHNYTLGHLFDDRSNYDMDHEGLAEATANVGATVWSLGWRKDRFHDLDREINEASGRSASREIGKVERYGKKYGWIGLQRYVGVLRDRGDSNAPGSRFGVDIDPSFPSEPDRPDIPLPTWARPTGQDEYWLRRGPVAVPQDLFHPRQINGADGPWVLVDGFLNAEDSETGRSTFGILTTVLVSITDTDDVLTHLLGMPHPGRHSVPEAPSGYYVFGGEVPWSQHFAAVPAELRDGRGIYSDVFEIAGRPVEMEIVAHTYSWEGHHSSTNQAPSASVPSKPLSVASELRAIPQRFHQVDRAGRLATLSLGAPAGFSGHLFYVREAELRGYAGDRDLLFFGWGERRLAHSWRSQSAPAVDRLYQRSKNVWRSVEKI